MSKFVVDKNFEAVKLNKRTHTPLGEHPITIPYGAILDDIEEHGQFYRFGYLMERYQVKISVAKGAFQPMDAGSTVKMQDDDDPPSHTPRHSTHSDDAPHFKAPARSHRAPAASGTLVFETLTVQGGTELSRAQVHGGWLVASSAGAVTFVPDPSHRWDGGSI